MTLFPSSAVRNPGEQQYLDLLNELFVKAARTKPREDRTGVGTASVFGRQIRFDLSEGFPLLTTKKLHLRSIVIELLWFLRGETNIRWLQENGVDIWNEWADGQGELGPVYGKQWRSWAAPNGASIDQIQKLILGLQTNPNSRRHIVSAWNPADVDDMALPPCHCLFQFYVADGKLSCQLYQRSADIFLGVPFNIASYALLTHMLAHRLRLQVGEFIHTFGDAHLYRNHMDQASEQLSRYPRPFPRLVLDYLADTPLDQINPADILFLDYEPHPTIKAPVAV